MPRNQGRVAAVLSATARIVGPLALAWAAAEGAAAASLRDTILFCDFDAKPVDQPIGTGGPALNEPVDVSFAPAIVRDAPLVTPCLAISDTSAIAGSVLFEFDGRVEIVSGTFVASMTLRFAEREDFTVFLREQGGATQSFLNVYFTQAGQIRYTDLDTSAPLLIGTYAGGTTYVLHIVIDLDARTYDLMLDADLLLEDEPLGDSLRGIGRLGVGLSNDPDTNGTLYLDDLVVSATVVPTAVEPTTWSSLKARWR
jgi:hypothetical protein